MVQPHSQGAQGYSHAIIARLSPKHSSRNTPKYLPDMQDPPFPTLPSRKLPAHLPQCCKGMHLGVTKSGVTPTQPDRAAQITATQPIKHGGKAPREGLTRGINPILHGKCTLKAFLLPSSKAGTPQHTSSTLNVLAAPQMPMVQQAALLQDTGQAQICCSSRQRRCIISKHRFFWAAQRSQLWQKPNGEGN